MGVVRMFMTNAYGGRAATAMGSRPHGGCCDQRVMTSVVATAMPHRWIRCCAQPSRGCSRGRSDQILSSAWTRSNLAAMRCCAAHGRCGIAELGRQLGLAADPARIIARAEPHRRWVVRPSTSGESASMSFCNWSAVSAMGIVHDVEHCFEATGSACRSDASVSTVVQEWLILTQNGHDCPSYRCFIVVRKAISCSGLHRSTTCVLRC